MFSVLVHQMCVVDTKRSVKEKRPKNVLKTSQSNTRSLTSLGRHQDVSLNIFRKIGF